MTTTSTQNLSISIIVPAYNIETFLAECIDSILAQTYKNFEVIIVNDGSTDNSTQICNYYKNYQNVTIIHSENEGVSSARNKGIDIARGEYLLFVDGDDILYPYCLQTFIDHIDQYPDIIIGGSDIVYYPGNKKTKYWGGDFECDSVKANFRHYADGKYIITPWNKLVRKDFIVNNNLYFQRGIIHEDELWSFRLLMYCNSLKAFSKATYIYRIREMSITTSARLEYKAYSLLQVTRTLYKEIYHLNDIPSALIISYETMKNKCMRAIVSAYSPRVQYEFYSELRRYRFPLLKHLFSRSITLARIVSYIHYLCPIKIGFKVYKKLLNR